LFIIQPPVLSNLSAVDGTGHVGPSTTGVASWTIVPSSNAAPHGLTTYFVGGTLSYIEDKTPIVVPLTPAPINVLPSPSLQVHYFLQRDVFSDDPFTPQIEPAEPFSLGVLVNNTGKGRANEVSIASAQPQIVENEKGLLVNFQILGTEVNG